MILKYGARGDEVVLVQKKLKELGFKGQTGKPLSIDGIFGEIAGNVPPASRSGELRDNKFSTKIKFNSEKQI